jgi:hypothetical protein
MITMIDTPEAVDTATSAGRGLAGLSYARGRGAVSGVSTNETELG